MNYLKALSSNEKRKLWKTVEKELEVYRLYKSFIDFDPDTSAFSKEQVQEMNSFCEKIERLIEQLPELEEAIIKGKYLNIECDYITDSEMITNRLSPPVTYPTYRKYRDRAFSKIAFFLGLTEPFKAHA